MRLRMEVVARGVDLSANLRREIELRAAKLDQFYARILRCRATVEGLGRHHRQGRVRLRLDLTVPGKQIVITRQGGEQTLEAITEAFNAAGRRIEDHIRRSRRFIKTHEPPPEARVARLFSMSGFGFLVTPDGREIYFHRNSVLGGFDRLTPGATVRYVEESGDNGPQATMVVLRRPRKRRLA